MTDGCDECAGPPSPGKIIHINEDGCCVGCGRPFVNNMTTENRPIFSVFLPGPISSGKNNMGVTRTGLHYPKPNFVKWRDAAYPHILSAKSRSPIRGRFPIDHPITAHITHVPTDRRRRDVPGMIDGLWHLLERFGVVKDDCLIENVTFDTNRGGDETPGIFLILKETPHADQHR